MSTTRPTEHRLAGPDYPRKRPKDDDLMMRAQVRDILWCIECRATPGPDHPTPSTCSNHTWIMFSRVFIALDGGPLYCHDCQRTIKGAGGHKDHAVQQIIDTEAARDVVGMFTELHEGLDQLRATSQGATSDATAADHYRALRPNSAHSPSPRKEKGSE